MKLNEVFKFRDEDSPKPFLDHLEDFRWMLIKMGVTLGTLMMLSFFFRTWLVRVIQGPLWEADPKAVENLQSLGVADSLTISFQLSFYAGIVLAFPFLLYYLAEFVLPALTRKEKRLVMPAVFVSLLLFLGGVAFAYFIILPRTLQFFHADARSLQWTPTWTVREYYSFATQFVLAFGIAFELPVAVLLLVKLGILDTAKLRQLRPHAFIVIFIFAAILTPTTDLLTLFCMGAPMYVLYEICILIAGAASGKSELPEGGQGP